MQKRKVCCRKGENYFLSSPLSVTGIYGRLKLGLQLERKPWLLCCGQIKPEFEEMLKHFYLRKAFWVFYVIITLKYHLRLPCAQGNLS